MTDHPTPGQPLTAESVGLLKAGDVLRCIAGSPAADIAVGTVCTFLEESRSGGISRCIVTSADPGFGFKPTRFTFIGRPGPDGWIAAPEGGWTENPVPGREVYIRQDCGWESKTASAYWDWGEPVTALRLTPTSPPIEDAERASGQLKSRPDGMSDALYAIWKDIKPGPDYAGNLHAEVKRLREEVVRLTTDQVSDVEVWAFAEKIFLAGHHHGWTGNQSRRDVAHVDAQKGWDVFVKNGALDKALPRALIARSQPKGAGQSSGDVSYLAKTLDKSPDEIRRALSNLAAKGLITTDNADGLSADREAVAWRWRNKTSDLWCVTKRKPTHYDGLEGSDYEVQPLYSAPAGQDLAADRGLTNDELKAQAARCGCRGSDEWCPCQNTADRQTVVARRAALKDRA